MTSATGSDRLHRDEYPDPPTILVVEDSPTQAAELRFLLRERGYAVIVARNGEEALDRLRERAPALVVSDVVMPGMNGYDLCRAIKSDKDLRDTPVILVTSLSSPHDVFHGLDAGADNFVTKPYEGRYLIARVEYLLTNRELRQRGKLQVGVEIELGGQRHFINAERQQILDLLISTYEEAVRLHDGLLQRERSLQRSYDSLNALYVLAKVLNDCRTRAEVASRVLERSTLLPGVRGAWMYLADGDGLRTYAAPTLPRGLVEHGNLETGCACKRAFLEGYLDEPLDVASCEAMAAAEPHHVGLRGHLAVPLVAGDEPVGILNLLSDSERGFGEEERRIIAAAAVQIASALDRARLYEGLEQKVAERTRDLEREVQDRRRAEARLRDAVDSLEDGFILWDADDRQVMTNGAFRRLDPRLESLSRPGLPFRELLAALAEHGIVADAGGEAWQEDQLRRHRAADGAAQLQQLGDGRWYLLRERRTSEGGVVTLQTDVTGMKRAQDTLELRARQQTMLAELGRHALGEENLDDVLARSAERVAAALGADYVGVYRPGPENGALRLVHGTGWRTGWLGDASIPTGPGTLAGSVIAGREAVVVPDWREERRFGQHALLADHGVRSSMGAMIEDRGKPYGMLGVHSRDPRRFGPEDAVLLWAVANTLGSAVTLRRANEEVALSEARFRDFAGCAADWFWETDPAQIFTYVSGPSTLNEAFGLTPEQIVGRSRRDVSTEIGVDLDPTPYIQERMDRVEPFQSLEIRCAPEGKGEGWIRLSGVPVTDGSGRLRAYRGAAQNITARKRAEIALEASVERFELAARASASGIWDWEIDSGNAYYAPRFLQLLGYEAVNGSTIAFLEESLHPDDRDRVLAALRDHLAARSPFEQEARLRTRDDDHRWFQIIGEAIWDGGGRPVRMCGSIVDVTERRLAQEHLRHSQKMEAIGTLTGGIAHDFNNMLTITMGNLDLLAERIDRDPMAERLIKDALVAADRSSSLTRQLLAFARRQSLEPQRVDLNALVTQTHGLLERVLGRSIEIHLHLGEGVWPVVVDPAQLDTVLVNLAVNARDAMPTGGSLTIETANAELDEAYAAQRSDVAPGRYVRLDISDSGSGMPPQVVERIFEPFFTTKEVGKGTGLGLAMVFGFIKQSGGHIAVYSEVGFGTTFRLYLPRETDATAPSAEDGPETPRARAGESVLVVDDEDMVRNIVCAQLETLGYRVLQVDGPGDGAAMLAAGESVDLVLSDVVMPGPMNGFDFAAMLRDRHPGVEVILVSGFADAALRKSRLNRADVDVMSKPFSKAELARRVRAALDRRRGG